MVVDAHTTFEFISYGSFPKDENGACIGMFPYYPLSALANIDYSIINHTNYDEKTKTRYETKSMKQNPQYPAKSPNSKLATHPKTIPKRINRKNRTKTKARHPTHLRRSLRTQQMKLRTRWVLKLTSTKAQK